MKRLLVLSSAALMALASAPSAVMARGYTGPAGGMQIADPDSRIEHMAAGVQVRGSGRGSPPKGACAVLRDDSSLREAYGCKK